MGGSGARARAGCGGDGGRRRRGPHLAGVVLAALALGATASAAVPQSSLPSPPRAVWTAAGQTLATVAVTFCWTEGGSGLCSDGIPPACVTPGTSRPRLVLPRNRRVSVRVALGFAPDSVIAEFRSSGDRMRSIRLPARRAVVIPVPAAYRGPLRVFATRAGEDGGDVYHGICIARGARAAR